MTPCHKKNHLASATATESSNETTISTNLSSNSRNDTTDMTATDGGKKPKARENEGLEQKKKCLNWSKGDDRLLLEKAINDCFSDRELKHDENGEIITGYITFAYRQGILENTFYKHMCPNYRRIIEDGNRGKKNPLMRNMWNSLEAFVLALIV